MKQISSSSAAKTKTNPQDAEWVRLGVEIFVVTAFLSLRFLLNGNMDTSNEVDVLPLARQYAQPTWNPHDWYLNQPPGYRLLFQSIFGPLVARWGFLTTSIVGRLVCYLLVASGLVLIGRRLGLNLVFLLLAVSLYTHGDLEEGINFTSYSTQRVAAGEWLIGALEAKSVAYGFVLLGIGAMLARKYSLMAIMLGLATSFHVLVGGWSTLAAIGWIWIRFGWKIRYWTRVCLIYLAASVFAIPAVVKHLLAASSPVGEIEPSYIYVFVRLPHHLNPLSWEAFWWNIPLVYLLILGVGVGLLSWKRHQLSGGVYQASLDFAGFTLLSLVPFVLALAIAPFDTQGKLLQYYPFRVGSVMLPLAASFLLVCAITQLLKPRATRVAILVSLLCLGWLCSVQATVLQEQLVEIRDYPGEAQDVTPAWQDLCDWIRLNTPQEALVITPPAFDLANFAWLSTRPTLVNYKLLPQSKAGLLSWYERLTELSGTEDPLQIESGTPAKLSQTKEKLTQGYYQLTTEQVKPLMHKYQAQYWVTKVGHQLNLPIAYQNSEYILYAINNN